MPKVSSIKKWGSWLFAHFGDTMEAHSNRTGLTVDMILEYDHAHWEASIPMAVWKGIVRGELDELIELTRMDPNDFRLIQF
jgi:hypothetical protein